MYYDGHERPDVIERRIEFLKEMAEYEKLMAKYSGEDCMDVTPPTLDPGQKELVLVVHDESTFYSNDGERNSWIEAKRGHAIRYKNLGASCNSSKFLSEKIGILRMTEAQYANYKERNPQSTVPRDSSVEMKCGSKYATALTGEQILGVSHQGWWNNELMLAQLHNAITVFEETHPGCQGLFLFDNSTGHNAYAEDALLAHKMSSLPGGKQPKMRDGQLPDGRKQSMTFRKGEFTLFDLQKKIKGEKISIKRGTRVGEDSPLSGLAKGSRQVCLEKNIRIVKGRTAKGKPKYVHHCCPKAKKTEDELFDDEMLRAAGREDQIKDKVDHTGYNANGVPCCCVWALRQCADFVDQKNAVEELIINAGHKVIFLPKYHPELNFIERFWAYVKGWLRKNCKYNMKGLWENFDKVFDGTVIPLSLIRKFARTSWRWMDCYRRGMSLELTTFATKVYHGHRQVPPRMDDLVNELASHKRKTAAGKLRKLIDQDRKSQVNMVGNEDVCVLSEVTPQKLVGMYIEKDFEGFGKFKGRVTSCGKDVLGRDIFRVDYLDGDYEDLFLQELIKFVRKEDIFMYINR